MGGYDNKRMVGSGIVALTIALSAIVVAFGSPQVSPPKLGPPAGGFEIAADALGSTADVAKQAERSDRPRAGSRLGTSPDHPDDELELGQQRPELERRPDSDTATGEPAPEAASRPTVLRFIYFVEADQEFEPETLDVIERQAIALQAFWYEQFGGTFRIPVDGVEVVYGDQPADWYATNVNGDDERWFRLMNIRAEMREKLNLDTAVEDTRFIAYPAARIDGRVGANRYEGAWMDGDDIGCIVGAVETTPYTQDFPANCLGTVAHELGHVYGLGHEGADEDCMQFGFYFYVSESELCDFSAPNRQIVTTDPRNQAWLDAEPGDRG